MSKFIAVIVGGILLLSLVLYSMTYSVNFHEVAIKTRFGKKTEGSVVKDAGLKFRLPLFADRVTKYDTRLQLRESPLETIQTADELQIVVRAFLLWRIDTSDDSGPLKFSDSYPGVQEANESLMDEFRTAIRAGLSRFTFNELIGASSKLKEAEDVIKTQLARLRTDKGIEPVTVGISQLMLSPKTSESVLRRMEATRNRLVESVRGEATGEATTIQSRASGWAEKIRAFAHQRAAEIRSQGNTAAVQYLSEMGKEEGLAVFLAWLDALKGTLSENTTVVIPTTFAPYHLLQFDTPIDANGIPSPSSIPDFDTQIEQSSPNAPDSEREGS